MGRMGRGKGANVAGPKFEKLLIVQERDCAIERLRRELDALPVRQREIEARLAEHRAALEASIDARKRLQARVREFETESGVEKGRIAKLRQQQMQLKTNEQFKAMDMEIRGVEKAISGIEDRELETMATLEAAEADVKAREAALRDEEARVAQDVAGMQSRGVAMQAELAALQQQRDTAAEGVDPEWLPVYARIFAKKRDAALVSIDRGVCGGCHMKLPPQLYHDAQKGDRLVVCNYCGRLLYTG